MDQDKGKKRSDETCSIEIPALQEAGTESKVHLRRKKEEKDKEIAEKHSWSENLTLLGFLKLLKFW